MLVNIPGGRLSCWDSGRGTPLLFIHGVGTSGEIWAEDLAPLAGDCRLIVYDRRGYGESSEATGDVRDNAADAAALIEALDAAPAVVVGFSGGSIAALDLALSRPELVAGLVLLDPAFNLKKLIGPRLLRALIGAQVARRVRGERAGAARWMRFAQSRRSGGSAFDEASPERRERLLANAAGVFADFGASGGGEHVDESRLASIAVPVLLIEAAQSPAFLRRSCARLRRLIPQARAEVLERSGHAVGFDALDEVIGLLREFVASVAPARTR